LKFNRAFFVDRDFDDLQGRLPDNTVYMTETYSIENCIVCREVLEDILKMPLLNFEWVFCGADRVKGGPRGMRPGAAHP
jgi:hypothetical protein